MAKVFLLAAAATLLVAAVVPADAQSLPPAMKAAINSFVRSSIVTAEVTQFPAYLQIPLSKPSNAPASNVCSVSLVEAPVDKTKRPPGKSMSIPDTNDHMRTILPSPPCTPAPGH